MSDIAISHGMVHNVEYDEQAKRVIKALYQDFKRFEGHKNTPSTFKAMCQSMNAIVERIGREYSPTLCPRWAFKYDNEGYSGRVTLHIMHPINGRWEYVVDPTFNPNEYPADEQPEPVSVFNSPFIPFISFIPFEGTSLACEPVQLDKKDSRGNLL